MTGADPLARLAAGAPDWRAPGRLGRWPGLLVGIAMLAAVVAVATHISEPREFARLVEHAEPWWIAVAIVLQAGTYVALAQVWRAVVRAARHALSLGVSTRIALAKLFVDNALPSGGISGSVLVASALEKRGLPVPVVTATIVIELASYYLAYAISLAVAVAVAAAQGHAGRVVVVPSLAFVAISIGIAFGAIALSRTARSLPRWFGFRRAGRWLAGADRQLTGDLRLLVRTTAWQLVIVAFDGATLWTLIRALGVHARPPACSRAS